MAFAIPSKNRAREIESEKKKEKERRTREMLASRAGRPGYCIVLSFGTNDLPRFPLYTAASYSPAKTRKGLQESPKATTMTTTGMGKGRGKRREKMGKGATEPRDMGGITYLWASGPGTEANFRQISVGNNVRAIGM